MDENIDEFSKKLTEQIERNNLAIAEAKKAIDKMRDLFKSLGADLDSGRNVFLESPLLSEEGRRQAKDVIASMEKEMDAKHAEYMKSRVKVTGDSDCGPESDGAGSNKKTAGKKFVKKMRL